MYQRMTQGVMIDKTTGEYITSDIEYIKRTSDGAIFPCVEENPDYQQYIKDVEAKATVTDFDYGAEEQRQAIESAQATAAQEKEALIQAKMLEMAVAELVAEGKLTEK